MDNPIAQLSLLGARPDEQPFQITVQIGTPYLYAKDPEEWACPVVVSPLFKNLRDAHGGDSFQALCLAVALAQDLLHGFRENGGVLSNEGDGEGEDTFPLEAYAFGAARRP
jgi:hypothetical protein